MKAINNFSLVVLLLNTTLLSHAQQTASVPSPTPYSVVQRNANSRIWESTSYELLPSGQVIPHIHHYTELATGLCYQQNGQWVDSQEQINILPDGTASATNGQYQVYFPVDIYEGTITLITPDGQQMQSQPVGLCYDDGTNLVLIGSLTNSIGSLVTNNQVIYPNAFTGIGADLRYTYRKSGFEQEVVLNQQLPPPEAFGLDSASANLEMLTEFFNAPEPTQSASVAGQNGLSDATLSFGSMKMVRGKAFSIGDLSLTNSQPGGIRVYKSWEQVGNRTFLVEALPYENIASDLSQLPAFSGTVAALGKTNKALIARILPSVRPTQAGAHQKHLAAASWHYQSGVVLDYQEVLGDETNFTFQGDTTYLVTGPLYLFGTTTIEGGTVVKYTINDPPSDIILKGPVNCETASYRKAIFTASDDNSVGEGISGSSGNPNTNGYYADWALEYDNPPYSVTLDNLEINYSTIALYMYSGSSNVIRDVQCVNDFESLYCESVTNYLENVLMYSSSNTCIAENSSCTIAENLTAHGGNGLWINYGSSSSLAATNCLFIGLAQLDNAFAGEYNNNNYSNSTASGIFQTVGGGSHYLVNDYVVTNNNNIRGGGTTNIDPALLADLAQKTTWPPIVYSNVTFSVATNFGPRLIRDNTNTVDLGYHYDSLDYVFGGCNLNTNLTFTNGTAVGWFENYGGAGSYDQPYAISLNNGANLSFDGNATQPDYFAKFDMVQEGENGNWPPSGYIGSVMLNGNNLSQEPLLSANFTKFSHRISEHNLFRDDGAYGDASFENCEFYNANFTMYDMQYGQFTNCLFFRYSVSYYDNGYDADITYINCTFYNGSVDMERRSYNDGYSTNFWLVQNCSFDGTAFEWTDNYGGNTNHTFFNYNAYNANNLSWSNFPTSSGPNHSMLETNGPNIVMVTNYNWETSWFGNFYLPTNSPIIQKGSEDANFLGLYWFTTQTNQTPETNAIVDIGYHYVATDTNGNPLATFGTNVPNYILYPDGAPPTILIQPTSQTVVQGSNATFSVTAAGFPPPSYQWYWEGEPLTDEGGISGSASATLNLSGVQPDQAGSYYVVVTNGFGSVTSSNAMLIVQPSQIGFQWPKYVMPPYAYWNVTDISDPAQPVNIGELQAPFSEPGYPGIGVPPFNTPWHTNGITMPFITVTNAYGTTTNGGTSNVGTVFQVGLSGQGLTVIHSFSGADGAYPCSQLAMSGSMYYGISNTLYGTTFSGGTNGYGTVFKVNTDGSGFADLYEFAGTNDGKYPQTGLLISENTLYGTTTNSIFKINTDGSDFTCLTNIIGASQLILSLSGDTLYGTTYSGGASNEGKLFSINTAGSGLTDLHDFTGGTNGEYPASGLELLCCSNAFANGSTTDTLYGTTSSGGAYTNGMVFSINTDGSGFTDLHDFTGTTDGACPVGGLLLTNNNNYWEPTYLYGTTSREGTNGGGTLFGMGLDGGTNFQTLYSFGGTNGAEPEGKLVFVGSTLYGTTSGGGAYTNGTVFGINYDGTGFTNLYNFSGGSDGGSPLAGLTLPVVDNLWSIWSLDTTINVSAENVTNLSYSIAIDDSYALFVNGILVSNILTDSWAHWLPLSSLPNLHPGENDIRAVIGGNGDGTDYFAMLIESASAFTNTLFINVFGTTSAGGSDDDGTVFEITPGGYETNLHSFSGVPDGQNPIGDLVLSGNTLYGVTEYGGTNDSSPGTVYSQGTVFSMNTNGSDFQTLYSFTNMPDGSYPYGQNPYAGLVLSGNTLYGTTQYGGTNNNSYGTIFSINTDGSNYRVLYNFGSYNNDGVYPQAPLLLVNNILYGTTYQGGNGSGGGTIFSINTDGSGYTNLYSFGYGTDGASSMSGLTLSGNTLYGTTYGGGVYPSSYGTIFSFSIGSSTDAIVHIFTNNGDDGQNPQARLTLSGDTLYGTTVNGGANGDGTIFSIVIGSSEDTILENLGSIDSNYGENPKADLIILGNSLYGTTYQGGTNGYGMVFSINTNGDFNDIYVFGSNPNDGENPEGGLCSP